MTDIDLMHDAAEIVGKWETWERHAGSVYDYPYDYLTVPDAKDPVSSRVLWDPLHSETDAFMIVKALIARGFSFQMHGPANISPQIQDLHWACVLYGNGTNGVGSSLEPARAITIACLKAVGVNTEC